MKLLQKSQRKENKKKLMPGDYFGILFILTFLIIFFLLPAEPFELREKIIGSTYSLHLDQWGIPVGLMVVLDDNQRVLARSAGEIVLYKDKKVLIREYRSKYLNRKKYVFMKYID